MHGSREFEIPLGGELRYYHGFSISELQVLATEAGMHIVQNEIFTGKKNIVSVLERHV